MSRTPSPTISITPSISVSTTPTLATVVVRNNSVYSSASDVRVNNQTISSTGFPVSTSEILTGYTSQLGYQNIDVYITQWTGEDCYIRLVDSNNNVRYVNIEGNSGHTFNTAYLSIGIPISITLIDGNIPTPSPSPPYSMTPTCSPSPSFSTSVTPTPTRTPTPTPTPFGPTVNITNSGTYNIDDITVNSIPLSGVTFPILPGRSVVGHTAEYGVNMPIIVTLSQDSTGEHISVNNSCFTTNGGDIGYFTGIDTTVSPITITYSTGICP